MSLDIYLQDVDGSYVFEYNITHNLGKMAKEAGLYEALWHPEYLQIAEAGKLIPLIQNGILFMVQNMQHCKTLSPSNGWGTYEGLLHFAGQYLTACKNYPNAKIETSV